MAVKTKNKIIKDLLQELNAVKSFYGRTDVSEAEKRTDINLLGCNQFGISPVFSRG